MPYRLLMRSGLSLATLAVAVLLSGCVPQGPEVTPPPVPSTEPVFASDEEALAAATDAYKAYLAMSDLIAQEGGKDPERIAPFVTAEWLEKEMEGNSELLKSGRKLVGNFEVVQTRLQQLYEAESAQLTVTIYACLSPNEARVIDSSGVDVTPDMVRTRRWTEATFIVDTHADPKLLLSGDEPWLTDSSC
jgi:hypothetical protein